MNDLKKVLLLRSLIGVALSLEISNYVHLKNFEKSIKPYEGQYKEFIMAREYYEKDRNILEKAATDHSRGLALKTIHKWDKDWPN